MNKVTVVVSVLLMFSIALNLYLLNEKPTQTTVTAQQSNPPEATLARTDTPQQRQQTSIDADKSEVTSARQHEHIQQIEQFIRAQQFADARVLINDHLKRYPQDIELRLLEAKVIASTESASSALSAYYELLDLPLTDAQEKRVRDTINDITSHHINNLRGLSAWDILSDFLEPLWQLDPNNVVYITNLAEAYARQQLAAPMENVLASLATDDRRVSQIRRLLDYTQNRTETIETEPSPSRLTQAEAVSMMPYGNHFMVDTKLNDLNVNLMIDTGASTTAISHRVLIRLMRDGNDIEFVGRYQVNTAGGRVTAQVYQVSTLSLGRKTVENVALLVLPGENLEPAEGLLGMNVLSKFDFHMDQQQSVLYLRDRP